MSRPRPVRRVTPPAEPPVLPERSLAGYVHAVAAELGVGPAGTGVEVADVNTGYVALPQRCPRYPNRDLMLVWGDRDGWVVAVETDPAEEPVIVAYFADDVLPEPAEVARFVRGLGAGEPVGLVVPPRWRERSATGDLAARLERYAPHARYFPPPF
ncbi:DUF6292 family protein [Amycolatopsis arida]|nr:DUF6292 family protein [Amycolatopsis arida]